MSSTLGGECELHLQMKERRLARTCSSQWDGRTGTVHHSRTAARTYIACAWTCPRLERNLRLEALCVCVSVASCSPSRFPSSHACALCSLPLSSLGLVSPAGVMCCLSSAQGVEHQLLVQVGGVCASACFRVHFHSRSHAKFDSASPGAAVLSGWATGLAIAVMTSGDTSEAATERP
jgi:hypothetical protein